MPTLIRRSLWGLGGFAALILLILAGGFLWLRGSLPQLDGNLELPGLAAPVAVLRDGDGIVTIQAQSELDAARALGFVHAQDRLWQMDFMRRTGAGRLSEVAGESTLSIDRFMRVLGLYRVAAANYAGLSKPVQDQLRAYAAGVNAFLAEPGGPLPLEFHILGYKPEPWSPTDSLVWGRLMALQLSMNWHDELRRAELAGRLSEEQLQQLWPPYPLDGPVTSGQLAALAPQPLRALREILPWPLAPKDASNAWALGGALTANGKALLANDPHLALDAPGIWYLARIETPNLTLTGATAPGVPFLILGHNDEVAWGLTTTHGDTQDLFIEQLTIGDPDQYVTPDGIRSFETREETIEIDGQAPELLTVRSSRHGPLLSDVIPNAAEAMNPGQVLALAWPALREDDRTAEALYRLNRANNWKSFHSALRDFHSPQQNILYADRKGNIAFMSPARVPIRKAGDGSRPVPGWSGDYDWAGLIPFQELPQSFNPPSGRIVTANNKVVPDDYPYIITMDWPAPQRAQRILERLDADGPQSPEASAAIQNDNLSLGARKLLPVLLAAKPLSERGRTAQALLQAWDQRMSRDAAAPLIFYAWLRALNETLLADELAESFGAFQRGNTERLAVILGTAPAWCDDITTEPAESCAAQIALALEYGLEGLEVRFGGDMADWRWGDAHRASFPHPVLSRVPVLGSLFGFEVEADGGNDTVNRGGARFGGPPENWFEDIHGPGYRSLYDLGDLAASRFMIATGQSGNPLSPFYGSLAERWRDGLYVTMTGEAPAHRLTLTPP